MQANRLFQIIYHLLDKGSATTRELAERFEVSRRTILRDVDMLSAAGVPVYTRKGRGGGIALLEGYVFNRSLLSDREQQDILSALQGMRAARYPEAEQVQEKLRTLFGRAVSDWIDVDFADWAGTEQSLFAPLRDAILTKRVVRFAYCDAQGERSAREAEPLQLWFKHHAWYLRAHCRTRGQQRLFRLTRMTDIQVTAQRFERTLHEAAHEADAPAPPMMEVRLLVDAEMARRVYDEFPAEQIQRMPDGRLLVCARYVEDAWVCGYVLSFGEGAEVLSPPRLRAQVRMRLARACARYAADEPG